MKKLFKSGVIFMTIDFFHLPIHPLLFLTFAISNTYINKIRKEKYETTKNNPFNPIAIAMYKHIIHKL